MEYHGIEKLRGSENWNVWKFAVKNLLRGTEDAYEVCISEIQKPTPQVENTTFSNEFSIRKISRLGIKLIVLQVKLSSKRWI